MVFHLHYGFAPTISSKKFVVKLACLWAPLIVCSSILFSPLSPLYLSHGGGLTHVLAFGLTLLNAIDALLYGGLALNESSSYYNLL